MLVAKNLDQQKFIFGFDMEWNWADGTHELTQTLQLCIPDQSSEMVAVLHLSEFECFSPDDFPMQLKMLLELPRLVPVGIQVGGDISRLQKLGVNVSTYVDVTCLAKTLNLDNPGGYGMQRLCARHLSLGVDKHGQQAAWSVLTDDLLEYAALDAHLSL